MPIKQPAVMLATLAGLASVPLPVIDSACAMGMAPRHILTEVQMPLALPFWLAGVRTSVVVNIGTAAIAADLAFDWLALILHGHATSAVDDQA